MPGEPCCCCWYWLTVRLLSLLERRRTRGADSEDGDRSLSEDGPRRRLE